MVLMGLRPLGIELIGGWKPPLRELSKKSAPEFGLGGHYTGRTMSALVLNAELITDSSATGDRELVERFVTVRDQAAFAELVRRHSSVVMGVCRRVLHDPNDIDDVFQATFLVLVRNAGRIRNRSSLAS